MATLSKISTTSLIVIDSRVNDWKSLIGDSNLNATLLVLDSSRDGLTQIADALVNSTNIDAIHIISHGNAGSLLLGSTTLDNNNLADYQTQLTAIAGALSSNADILLYGCDVAQGDIGQQFIEQLSVLTGADIAASTDLTGAANQGGNWVLESQTGTVETVSVITNEAQNAYSDTLANLPTWIFNADNGLSGAELWITDGSELGSHLLKNINITGGVGSNPKNFTALGNSTVVFNADDGINGAELWVTDGTTGGTNLVIDIYTGGTPTIRNSGDPQNFGVLGNGRALFSANNGTYQELWVTDGTKVGTMLLDINVAGDSSPYAITSLSNGKALFGATDSLGTELWVSDGTMPGTQRVQDINVGANSSDPNFFTLLGNGTVVFSANDGTGSELWSYDLAQGVVSLLENINQTDATGSDISSITSLGNGWAVFSATDITHGLELWATNGTVTNLIDINLGAGSSSPASITQLSIGLALFSANDGTGLKLWVTDGTLPGTHSLGVTFDPNHTVITSLGNGKALFSGYDAVNGVELWITDGTTASLVKDIYPGVTGSNPSHITTLGNGTALFSAGNDANGTELWFTDGVADTHLVKDINQQQDVIFPTQPGSSSPSFITLIDTTNTSPADLSIDENVAANSVVGTLTSPYPAGTSTFTFLGGGTDDGTFTIVGDQLHIKSSPNFEAINRYNISLHITDINGLYVDKSLVIGINNVNETPTNLAISKNNINENVAINNVDNIVGTLITTDPDAGNTFTYSKVTGTGDTDNSLFSIINGNQLKIDISPDFETKTSYSIRLNTTDQDGLSFEKALTININNLNDLLNITPVTINYTDTPFVDNFASQTGSFVSTSDPGHILTYGITGGTPNIPDGSVSKTNAYGTLTVKTATGIYSFAPISAAIEPLNANASDGTLTVTLSDGSTTVSQPFTVGITQSGITESTGNDSLTGTAGNDIFNALAGNDTINGLAGSDTINGGTGDDILDGGVSDVYNPGVIDTLNGDAGNDSFLSRGFFGAGNYNGGLDTDTLDFSQSDTYTNERRTNEGAGVSVNLGLNKATTYYLSATAFTWADANGQLALSNIENVKGTNQGDLLYGDSNANSIEGLAGNDVLYGAGGADTLVGGDGNDTYYMGYNSDVLDVITENATAGAGSNDIVFSVFSNYTLADNVENLTLLTGGINGTGNISNNTLTGNTAGNSLSGGIGDDTLDGGAADFYYSTVITDTLNGDAGNDTFLSRSFYGKSSYDGGTDTDTLDFSQADSYTAERRSAEGAGVSIDLSTGSGSTYYLSATNFTWIDTLANGQITVSNIENIKGSSQADKLIGDTNANSLDGGAGSDNISGGTGNDTLDGGVLDTYIVVTDTLNGDAGNDTFLSRGFFGAGNYNGGLDTDLLDFSQSDSYTATRRTNEGAGVSVDLGLNNASTYYLSATAFTWKDANGQLALSNIENVKGTNQGDLLYGDSNANSIEGLAGNDVLYGAAGSDTLVGGDGNDTYYMGYNSDVLDVITENATVGAGTNDSVLSFFANYTLADNVEILILQTGALNGTGNTSNNTLTGNTAGNSLSGGAGDDTLDGGASDAYYFTVITDTLNGDAGNDTFLSRSFYGKTIYDGGADTDTLDFSQADSYTAGRRSTEGAGVSIDLSTGSGSTYYLSATNFTWIDTLANGQITVSNIENIKGSSQADKLIGDTNANSLDGGAGSDNISGGAGNDTLDGGVLDTYIVVTDTLNGDAGNDTFLVRGFFGVGNYNGGADSDTLDFSQADSYTAGRRTAEGAGVDVNLAYSVSTGKASTYYLSASNFTWADANGQLTLTSIENVTGTNQADRLLGDNNDNLLQGGAGNDLMYGLNGADTLVGGTGKDTYNLNETIAASDRVAIAEGDSLTTSYDLINGFALGTGASTADKLDLVTTTIAINGAADKADVGIGINAISSHNITNGIISFDNAGAYDTPVAVTATNLANVIAYLQANITGGDTVAFTSGTDTFVFQDGVTSDTLVELVGVTATSIDNIAGLTAGAVWLV